MILLDPHFHVVQRPAIPFWGILHLETESYETYATTSPGIVLVSYVNALLCYSGGTEYSKGMMNDGKTSGETEII